MSPLGEDVLARLSEITDPCSVAAGNAMNIVEMGLIKDVEVRDDEVHVHMCLTSPTCPMLEHFGREMEDKVNGLPGVSNLTIHPDTGMEWTPDRLDASAKSRRQAHLITLSDRLTRHST